MAAQHQHYVPQLLLRGFLSRDPAKAAKDQVHVFDLEAGTQFTPLHHQHHGRAAL